MNHTLSDVICEQLSGIRLIADGAGLVGAAILGVVETVPDDLQGVLLGAAALAVRQIVLLALKWASEKFGGNRRTSRNRRSRLLNKNKTETL